MLVLILTNISLCVRLQPFRSHMNSSLFNKQSQLNKIPVSISLESKKEKQKCKKT
jgi:hypothetical protein